MKILLAADGSNYTKRMLAYLAAHDEMLGPKNRYTVLTVVPGVPPEVTHYVERGFMVKYYQEQADTVLQPIKAFAAQNHWDANFVHEVGRAAEVISKLAETGRFDLVVLGSHGHSALGNLVLGSVAAGVLAQCKTPTLVIR